MFIHYPFHVLLLLLLLLISSLPLFLTNDFFFLKLFYIRSHAPVPYVTQDDIENFRLTIDTTALGIPNILELTLDQIKAMPRHEIVATLQCSGNRRAEFNTKSQTSGTPWYQGAISTAKWSGVRLRDILKAAGIDDDKLCQNLDAHVRFATLDDFHSSITIDKAYSITGDCIVAYEMNGEPIPGELSLLNNH